MAFHRVSKEEWGGRYFGVAYLRARGLSWAQIGQLFGVRESTIKDWHGDIPHAIAGAEFRRRRDERHRWQSTISHLTQLGVVVKKRARHDGATVTAIIRKPNPHRRMWRSRIREAEARAAHVGRVLREEVEALKREREDASQKTRAVFRAAAERYGDSFKLMAEQVWRYGAASNG